MQKYLPTNIYIFIAQVFTIFLKNLSEKNNLLPQHTFIPSAKRFSKKTLFDLPDIEQRHTIRNNPHHWLHTDFLQHIHIQYPFVFNILIERPKLKNIFEFTLSSSEAVSDITNFRYKFPRRLY